MTTSKPPIENYRRKITQTWVADTVPQYTHWLECGHSVGGKPGATHKAARDRRTALCFDCWTADWSAE